MPVTNVSQITSSLNVLQLAEALPLPPTSVIQTNTSAKYLRQSPMDASNTVLSKQGNQNAAALSPEEGIGRPRQFMVYPVVQENGQRRYGPPPNWNSDPPPRGCEVFIGKIPRDCSEEELIPVFERIGPIYMFRLMMEFNGANRGYGFCVYTNREHTKRAVQELDNYEIRKGKTIGVCFSVDNCRLFVGGIPKNKTREEIMIEMKRVTDGVKDVISYPSITDKSKNRGFAFVEYESHKAAAMARRKLMPGRIQLWNQQIAVDWAEPEREVNEDIMSKVKILYVRNLMLSTTEDTLREHFVRIAGGDPNCVERVKKISDYAFIHFKEREVAAKCMELLNGTTIDGSKIEVTWAKPVDKSEASVRQSTHSSKFLGDLTIGKDIRQNNPLLLDPRLNLAAASSILPQMDPAFSFLLSPVGQPTGNQDLISLNPTLTSNPAAALALGTNGCSRIGAQRLGRRNAAGSRGAGMMRDRKHPVEVLEEQCRIAGWGIPSFTILPADFVDTITGAKVQLYLGQVFLPNLRLQFQAQRYYATPEEAKIGVSEVAISNLQFNQLVSLEGIGTPKEYTGMSLSVAVENPVVQTTMQQSTVQVPVQNMETTSDNRPVQASAPNSESMQSHSSSNSRTANISMTSALTRVAYSNDTVEPSVKTGSMSNLELSQLMTPASSKPPAQNPPSQDNRMLAKADCNNYPLTVPGVTLKDVQPKTLPTVQNQAQHMTFGPQPGQNLTPCAGPPTHMTSAQPYRPYLEPQIVAIPAAYPIVDPFASNYALTLGSNLATPGTAYLPWQLTSNGHSPTSAIGLLQTQPLVTTPNQAAGLGSPTEATANLGLNGLDYSASFVPNPYAAANLIASFTSQPTYLIDPTGGQMAPGSAIVGGSATGVNGIPSSMNITRMAGNGTNDLISTVTSISMAANSTAQPGLYNIGIQNPTLTTQSNILAQVGNNVNQMLGIIPSATSTLTQPTSATHVVTASSGNQNAFNCLSVPTPSQLS